jgi:CRISPR-associated endonuclease/helicase Cas3
MRESFETKHAKVGEAAVDHWYGTDLLDPASAPAVVVGTHHGERDPRRRRDNDVGSGGDAWAGERQSLIDALVAELGQPPADIDASVLDLACGLVTVADWIGSDEAHFPPHRNPATDKLKSVAEKVIRACGWSCPVIRPDLTFGDVCGEGLRPRPSQQAFIDSVTGPGLYFLEAPMGEGKTEAALYAAYRLLAQGDHQGLYFGLPTRLTSDRIHTRVRTFLERICPDPDVGALLAHGTAWLRAFEVGGEAFRPGGEWFHARKRGLLYPFAVGTIDQALLSVLNVRHAYVRAFGLAGKVVVLDEVHTYDSYTGTLLDRLVRSLLDHGSTVIVLSATLTGERRCQIGCLPVGPRAERDSYPLITSVRDGRAQTLAPPASAIGRTVKVRLHVFDDDAVAATAVAAAMAGACVVCIANTVGRAQRWYNAVLAAMPADAFAVGLLHAKFTARRRADIEDQWMDRLGSPHLAEANRPNGCILVATQVVEQSVDIDADFMISELAPTDMLLQRAGRLWRHRRERRPCLHPELAIVTPPLDGVADADALVDVLAGNAFVYAPYVLWRSHGVWRDRASVDLPGEIRELVESTYSPLADEPDFVSALREQLAARCRELRLHANAAMSQGLPTRGDDDLAAPTRWSEVRTLDALLVQEWDDLGTTATLVLPDDTELQVDANRPDFAATRALHKHRVAVPAWIFPNARTPSPLRQHFSSGEPVPVLVIDEDGRLLHNGIPTPLAYDERRGLQRLRDDRPDPRHTSHPDSETPTTEDFIDELDW